MPCRAACRTHSSPTVQSLRPTFFKLHSSHACLQNIEALETGKEGRRTPKCGLGREPVQLKSWRRARARSPSPLCLVSIPSVCQSATREKQRRREGRENPTRRRLLCSPDGLWRYAVCNEDVAAPAFVGLVRGSATATRLDGVSMGRSLQPQPQCRLIGRLPRCRVVASC